MILVENRDLCHASVTRDIDIAIPSVLPSVCLSVRYVPDFIKTTQHFAVVSSPHDSPTTLVL